MLSKSIDNKQNQKMVLSTLKGIRLGEKNNLHSSKPEYYNGENGVSIVYRDKNSLLGKIVDIDLEGKVKTLRMFEYGTLTQALGYDKEGYVCQLGIWNNKVLSKLYILRKDGSVGSQAEYIKMDHTKKNHAIFESIIFDQNGKIVESYEEIEELVFNNIMKVWMLKN